MAKTVQVRHYEALAVGKGAVAQDVLRLCQSVDSADVGRALDTVARFLCVSPWTVYRWLRGLAEPKGLVAATLRGHIARLPSGDSTTVAA